jgi:hypothetical protein
MVKVLLAVVLLAHGIGHSMGLLQVFKVATVNPSFHGDSWLLSGSVGPSATQVVAVGLWTAAIVLFAGVAGVVVGWLPAGWWQPLAIAASVVSLAGIALFPTAFPLGSTVGAVVVDLAVLAAVLWFHWVPGDLTA